MKVLNLQGKTLQQRWLKPKEKMGKIRTHISERDVRELFYPEAHWEGTVLDV